jgi:hypothetical protein
MDSWTAAAARNNGEWCDLVCRTHKATTLFDAAAWTSATRTPPHYPDAVTMAAEVSVVHLLARIDSTAGWSINDSFATIDLRPLGFRVLFDAQWIVSTRQLVHPKGGRRWERLRRDDLAEWEAVWQGDGDRLGLFKAELFDDERVTFLASYERDHVVAGAILNRSNDVVGISNSFPGRRAALRHGTSACRSPRSSTQGFGWSATNPARASTGQATVGSPLRGPFGCG